ncbi:copper amine oxidase N-terminal domain-containing protein [Brevibacillus borstelensis]|uniref:stalk domain-containing protein n=1 Tax=Brevibacillus borstelensis TaxID=45462 RepID=UPI0020411CA8|nr:stalk domain-containing protein [Brevibacillus borstelensis]MCM3594012.1 copper amine oxidase N-terminal domain-containing protein [Brevibacillus borstelensis]
MRKLTILLIVVFSLLMPLTTFGQTQNNYWYQCTIDPNLTDVENGKHWVQTITYQNGATTTINERDTFPFLMINNNFIPNADIAIKSGYSLVPIRLVTEELGGRVNWDAMNNTVVIESTGKKIVLKAGDRNAVINGKPVVLPFAPQLVDNRVYVPSRTVAEAFGADISFTVGIMPFTNPLLSMDTREKNVTKEKAIQLASNAMIQAFATFLKNGKYADGSYTSNKTLAEIKQRINSISYQDETAGYWILSGPYEILVDKSIEALFFKYGTKAVSGSYMEGITPVDVNDMDVFARGYFLG